MKKLEIYEFQADDIENALRLAANALSSHNKETSMDRDIIQALEYIRNCISGDIDKRVPRT